MFKGLLLAISGCVLSTGVIAGGVDVVPQSTVKWGVNGALGYGEYSKIDQSGSALGRFGMSISNQVNNQFNFGLEVNIQNGQRMRLNNDLVETPVDMTLLPQIDLLASMTMHFLDSSCFLLLKGGGTYIKATFDRRAIADKSAFKPEMQFGGGVSLNNKANLVIFYQRIFASNSDNINDIQLPTQNAAFLGFNYSIS